MYVKFQWKGKRHWDSPGSLIAEPCRWHPRLALWTGARVQDAGAASALAHGRLTSVPTFYISHGNGEENELVQVEGNGDEEEEEEKEEEEKEEEEEEEQRGHEEKFLEETETGRGSRGKVGHAPVVTKRSGPFPLDQEILSTNLVKVYDVNPVDKSTTQEVLTAFSAVAVGIRVGQTPASAGPARRLLGHLRAIQTAYEAEVEYALVVEDSVSAALSPWWTISLEDFANGLPKTWQAAQLMYHSSSKVGRDDIPKVDFRLSAGESSVPNLSKPFSRGATVGFCPFASLTSLSLFR